MARMGSSSFVVGITACLLLLSPVQAGTSDHRYNPAEHVELWVNKVRNVEESIVLHSGAPSRFGTVPLRTLP